MGTPPSEQTVCRMVETVRPDWEIEAVERVAEGTDFVAFLDVTTPDGDRRVVCKAATADHVPPACARAEPYLLDRVTDETSIPVPELFGYRTDHDELPAPFYLMAYVEGDRYSGATDGIDSETREQVMRDGARHLAILHELESFEAVGRLGLNDGDLRPVDVDHEPAGDTRQWALAHAEDAIDSLPDGGYFAELDDRTERFADLVPDLRAYVRETLPGLPRPEEPRLSHIDYRYGNLVVEPGGGVRAVLDWGNMMAVEPVYAVAVVESMLLSPAEDGAQRTETLRALFRQTYAETRDNWEFTPGDRERIEQYQLVYRLDAMACLPLWHSDDAERDRYERLHREFVDEYL